MMTATRIFPKVSARGVAEIPDSAWDPIRNLVADHFPAGRVKIHSHDVPGSFHGWPPMPPIYAVELIGPKEELPEMVSAVNGLAEEIVNQHTSSNTNIPANR